MRKHRLLAALALLLIQALIAQAQANNTLRGKVRSTNGTTLNNAIVELRTNGGALLSQTVTRNDGDFAFSNLEPGEYTLEVTFSGYQPTSQLARFNQPRGGAFQEVVNIEIVLQPRAETVITAPASTNFAQDVPKPAKDAYEKAVIKLREGKSDEAITLLREAIAQFNDYFNANFALATELCRIGKYQEALEPLDRARQINERDSSVYYLFGQVMLKQRKYVVADYAFREALRYNANHIASHYYRGITLIEIGFLEKDSKQSAANLGEAEKELRAALDLSDKKLHDVYLQLARIYERRGEKDAAARVLEDFLKADPDSKQAAKVREAIEKLRGSKK
jgi:tetratricopeptide (TPR) repeat protein